MKLVYRPKVQTGYKFTVGKQYDAIHSEGTSHQPASYMILEEDSNMPCFFSEHIISDYFVILRDDNIDQLLDTEL